MIFCKGFSCAAASTSTLNGESLCASKVLVMDLTQLYLKGVLVERLTSSPRLFRTSNNHNNELLSLGLTEAQTNPKPDFPNSLSRQKCPMQL